MSGLFVTLVVLASADGGASPAPERISTFVDDIYNVCPEAGPSVTLDGGLFPAGTVVLLPPRAARVACLMETCDVDRQAKAKTLEQPTAWWGWATGFFALGVALGSTVGVLLPR